MAYTGKGDQRLGYAGDFAHAGDVGLVERVEQCSEGVWYVIKVQNNVRSRMTFWPVIRSPHT
jgi:hypothetical protein